MLTKDELPADLRHESKGIQHVATKVRPDAWDRRPTPAQRSTIELARYLTVNCRVGVDARRK